MSNPPNMRAVCDTLLWLAEQPPETWIAVRRALLQVVNHGDALSSQRGLAKLAVSLERAAREEEG